MLGHALIALDARDLSAGDKTQGVAYGAERDIDVRLARSHDGIRQVDGDRTAPLVTIGTPAKG